MYYDPEKDRSEEFGWKKVQDETHPTEQEQDRWAAISVAVVVSLAVTGVLLS